MDILVAALNWAFGLFFLLGGLAGLASGSFAGAVSLAIALLLLPPVRKLVSARTGRTLPFKYRAALVFGLFVAMGAVIGAEEDGKAAAEAQRLAAARDEAAARKAAEAAAEFARDRVRIISEIRQAVESDRAEVALESCARHRATGDAELTAVCDQAALQAEAHRKTARVAELQARLASLPPDACADLLPVNRELVSLLPDVPEYRAAVERCEQIVQDEARQAKQDAIAQERERLREAKKKEQVDAQFSPWDGSHIELTKVIKGAMNDPGSYEHVETVYWIRPGDIVVQTKFRGKNAFGALMLNRVKARVGLDGKVIEILEQE